jgi:DNA modification methylase
LSEPDIFMPSEIVFRNVDELLPFAHNSRLHSPEQINLLASVIKQSGWTNPCLIADGGILAGHGRVMAAKKLGLNRVPCIDLSHLSDVDRRALVIQDNRLAEFGTSWDLEMLKIETDFLREEGFDLLLTGFDDDELAALIAPEIEITESKDPDDAPGAREEAVSVPGDVWLLGAHRVCCGSATVMDDWDRLMDGELADVVLTDPPYRVDYGRKNNELDKWDGGSRSKTGGIKNDKMSADDFRQFLCDAFGSLFAVMQSGAPIYVFHSDIEGTAFRNAFEGAGLHLQSCLVWKKNTMVLGRLDYQSIHETVIYGYKKGSAHRWYGGRKNTSVIDLGEGSPFKRMDDGRYQIKVGDSVLVVSADAIVEEHPSSVIYEPRPTSSGLHPTQKPVALIERMLRNSARAGDIVVDAFGGSGSTLLAADRLGMCARIMELEPRFVDVIIRRWQDYSGKRAVHAVTGRPFEKEVADAQVDSLGLDTEMPDFSGETDVF